MTRLGAVQPTHRRHAFLALLTVLSLAVGWLTVAAPSAAADGPTTFSNTASIGIPASGSPNQIGPASPYPSNILVSGMAGPVTKVTVSFNNLTHGSVADIDAMVVAPTGANLIVMSDVGGDNLATIDNKTLVFDDAAAGPVPAQVNIPAGTYKPTNTSTVPADSFPSPAPSPSSQTTLGGAFTGITANGTWSLYVVDDATGETGTMAGGWSLTITTETAAVATSTTVTTSGTPSTTGDPVTFTATVTSGGSPVTAGTVQFSEGGSNLGSPVALNASGHAALTTSALTEGTHAIVATYSGATGFLTSNGSVTQRVDNATVVTGNTFCNPGRITIPSQGTQGAAGPYPSNIKISGLAGQITKVTASLKGLSHTAPIDIDALLAGPTPSRNLFLLSDVGGNGNPISGVNLTFDDAAASTVPSPIVSGTYRPTNVDDESNDAIPAPAPAPSSATALSTFNGASPNGTWSLWVVDDASGDSGSISGGWCVTVTSQVATTTTLTSSATPSTFGAPVTFTAAVTGGGSPVTTGTVQFTDGATALEGPVALGANGKATLTTSALTVGTHTIHATYSGAAGFGESSDDLSQVVDKAASTTTLTTSGTPSDVGVPVTFTATVASTASPLPTGSVTFSVDGTAASTVALDASGTATFTTSALPAGSHTIRAAYGGDTDHAPSRDELTQVVNKIATTTSLGSDVSPSSFAQPVTFTATVTSRGGPVTTGGVQFSDGATTLGVVSVALDGSASFTTSTLSVGSHTITAAYAGTDVFASSTASVVQDVGKASTTTVVTSDVSPSIFGQSVTFSATVSSGGTPLDTGSVEFTDGATSLGTAPVAAGTATLTTSGLSAGTHTITGTYSGTADYAGSQGSVDQVVSQAASTTSVSSDQSPSTFGQMVTFTATVSSGGTPLNGGSVQFSDGGTALGGPHPVVNGTASLGADLLTAGSHTITATYSGTDDYAGSSGSVTQLVNPASTATTVKTSGSPSTVGQPVTFTATVISLVPVAEGTVQFSDGATALGGPVALSPDGTAALTTSDLTVGTHTITATYLGAANFAASSGSVVQVVEPMATSTTLDSAANPSILGQTVTFTATVTSDGAPVTSGEVQFKDGGVPLGSRPLTSEGTATLPVSDLTVGTHTITATFSGTTDLGTSTSDGLTQTVGALVADAGGPYAVAEGGSVTLDGSGSSPGVSYAWDLDDDGHFGDVTGTSPTLSWADLERFGINDGLAAPKDYPIALQVTSGSVTETDSTTIAVSNTAPTAVITGSLTATVGVPFTVKVGAEDPSSVDTAAQFTYSIDWGDGSAVETVTGPADPPVTHTYTSEGTVSASFTATDKDGGTGDPTAVEVQVGPAQTPTAPPSTAPPAPSTTSATSGTSASSGGLASTGSTIGVGTIVIGAILLAAGCGLLLMERRRRTARGLRE